MLKLPKHWKMHENRERNYNSRLVNTDGLKYLGAPHLAQTRLDLDLIFISQEHESESYPQHARQQWLPQ